jgi:hypothetical protein
MEEAGMKKSRRSCVRRLMSTDEMELAEIDRDQLREIGEIVDPGIRDAVQLHAAAARRNRREGPRRRRPRQISRTRR